MAPKQPRSFIHFSSSCWNLLLLLLGILASVFASIPLRRPHLLLVRRVEIDPIDGARHLIEADIIKSLKTCTIDLAHAMVWHQEFLLPAHEHILAVCAVLVMEIGLLGLLCKRSPSGKASPMLHVFLIAGAPVLMPGLERIFWTNDLTFKERSECSVFGCETCDCSSIETPS